MHNHFTQHLDVKSLLNVYRPHDVIEVGAGSGENTAQLYDVMRSWGGSLTVISDGERPDHLDKGIAWVRGIGHLQMWGYRQQSVDWIIIDSDHNYYTLQRELSEAHRILLPGGMILLHDTESYDHNSGKMPSYGCGVPYPAEEICSCEERGLMYGDALRAFCSEHREYREVARSRESCGAVAIQKPVTQGADVEVRLR